MSSTALISRFNVELMKRHQMCRDYSKMINLLAKWPANIHYAQLLTSGHDFIIIGAIRIDLMNFEVTLYAPVHLVHININDTM